MRTVILRFAMLALAVAVVGLVAAPETHATCSPAKLASNSGYTVGGSSYQYLEFPGKTTPGFNGRFWQPGSTQGTNNEGGSTFDINPFMFLAPYGSGDDWVFNINLGGANAGCPGGAMTLYLEDPASGRAITWTVQEGATQYSSLNFSFTFDTFGTVVVPTGARPQVSNSSRAGTTVNVAFSVPDLTPTERRQDVAGAITSRGIFIRQSATPPSTDIAGWTPLGATAAGAGPAEARSNPFDCTNTALDWWLATGFSVDGQPVRFVSQPVQIECDPNLADPTGTFQKINRPNTGAKRQDRD